MPVFAIPRVRQLRRPVRGAGHDRTPLCGGAVRRRRERRAEWSSSTTGPGSRCWALIPVQIDGTMFGTRIPSGPLAATDASAFSVCTSRCSSVTLQPMITRESPLVHQVLPPPCRSCWLGESATIPRESAFAGTPGRQHTGCRPLKEVGSGGAPNDSSPNESGLLRRSPDRYCGGSYLGQVAKLIDELIEPPLIATIGHPNRICSPLRKLRGPPTYHLPTDMVDCGLAVG